MIGTTVGSYRVKQRLGQGGVGSVYRVEHTVLGTMHALKVLTMPSERARQRLLSEGQIQARLRDPHLVAVRDVVDVAGQPGLVLDLVEGPTLGRLLAAGPLPLEAIGRLGTGMLRGMARAHAEGLVHRDLKPANVLLEVTDDDLVAKVADFGLAREAEGPSVTASGASLGTPRYMAPEQVRDPRDVDARSDVWALGVVLYEMCCGQAPFDRDDDLLALYSDIAAARFEPLATRRSGLPQAWLEAVAAALQVDRTARPADAAALLALWGDHAGGGVPESVVATARSLAPAMVDDPAPQLTWSGGDSFDSLAAARVGVVTPPEAVAPEAFPAPPVAPLPHPTRQSEVPSGAPLAMWGMAGAGFGVVLVVCVGLVLGMWLLFWPNGAPPPPVPVPPVAPVPVVSAPAPGPSDEAVVDWRGATVSQRAWQALLDADAAEAGAQAGYVVAAAPVEQPQLVILAADAARSHVSSAWEELERGRFLGLPPIQLALADALGDPDELDADLMATGNAAALYARLRLGPRHPARDGELLRAMEEAVGDRRLVQLARAQVAMQAGEPDAARGYLDRALAGDDVPELVRVTDALWHLHAGDEATAAMRIDAVIDEVDRPSQLAWVVRAEVDERGPGREVLASESKRRAGGAATVASLRRMLRADRWLAAGDVAGGLEEALAAEKDLHRYEKSKEVNAVRLDLLTELARLGALAGERAVVVEVLARLEALATKRLPPSKDIAGVRVALVQALLASVDGNDGPATSLRGDLERRPVGYALERRVLDDVVDGAPLRVHPTQLP